MKENFNNKIIFDNFYVFIETIAICAIVANLKKQVKISNVFIFFLKD